ncbi:MAG: hypothetical protein ACOCW9_07545, partial [Thermodesulfobacteriota bacterium]
ANAFDEIQAEVDKADRGLNPLGLEKNVMPFDISAGEIDEVKTHFEQIYDRAVLAISNATTVFNYAVNSAQELRKQSNTIGDYQKQVAERRHDYMSRLIELFGKPESNEFPNQPPTFYVAAERREQSPEAFIEIFSPSWDQIDQKI